jgi:endonuclease-3 related protein
LEIALTAILVQRCNWSVAWQAVGRLRARGLLCLPELASAREDVVQKDITGVAFAARKAGRLIDLARNILNKGYATIEDFLAAPRGTGRVREELLSMPGIGRETADAILLFASEHPVFVVDEYTRRIFRRLKLLEGVEDRFWDRPYEMLRQFFERHVLEGLSMYAEFRLASGVPREVALLRDWHAQLVELGKHHCLKSNPRCHASGNSCWREFDTGLHHCPPASCRGCPLSGTCAHARGG